MEIRTFEPKIDATEAVNRADRIDLLTYLRWKLASFIGHDREPEAVTCVYYPDYIAYSTVVFPRYIREDRTEKFLAGIDAVTGRVGEVDVELPEREALTIDAATVIEPEFSEVEAEEEWRDWIFTYIDRNYRPFRQPDFSLDRLELLYVPYWLVDYGSVSNSYVISGLTEQVEEIRSLKAIEGYYKEKRA